MRSGSIQRTGSTCTSQNWAWMGTPIYPHLGRKREARDGAHYNHLQQSRAQSPPAEVVAISCRLVHQGHVLSTHRRCEIHVWRRRSNHRVQEFPFLCSSSLPSKQILRGFPSILHWGRKLPRHNRTNRVLYTGIIKSPEGHCRRFWWNVKKRYGTGHCAGCF